MQVEVAIEVKEAAIGEMLATIEKRWELRNDTRVPVYMGFSQEVKDEE